MSTALERLEVAAEARSGGAFRADVGEVCRRLRAAETERDAWEERCHAHEERAEALEARLRGMMRLLSKHDAARSAAEAEVARLTGALAAAEAERNEHHRQSDEWKARAFDLAAALAAAEALEAERDAAVEQLNDALAVYGRLETCAAEVVRLTARAEQAEAFVRRIERFARFRGHGQIPNWELIADEARAALGTQEAL